MFSTSEGCHEYIGGDILSTSGGHHDACGEYHDYIRRCSVRRGDTMSTSGDIMSTSGVYHECIRGCSVHWGFHAS